MEKRLIIIFFLLFPLIFIFGKGNFQQGYIITNDGDSILGLIDFATDRENMLECIYKMDETSEIRTYRPGEIQGYRFSNNGKYYVSKVIDLGGDEFTAFLEYLVQGIMNLYFYEYSYERRYFFFENEDGTLKMITKDKDTVKDGKFIEDKKYLKTIVYDVYQNNHTIAQEVNNIKFNQKSMIEITKAFHNDVCTTGEECIVFENTTPDKVGFQFNFAVYTGIQLSTYFINRDNSVDVADTKSVTPVFGGQVYMLIPRWSTKFSAFLDASFSRFHCDSKDYISSSNNSRKYSYDNFALSARVGLKYTYPLNKFRPTVEFGFISTNMLGSPEYTVFRGIIETSGNINYLHHSNYRMRATSYGYTVAIGSDYKIGKEHYVFLKIAIENYAKVDLSQFSSSNYIKTPHVKVGYIF